MTRAAVIVIELDRDLAAHLAVAVRRHRDALRRNLIDEPPGLAQLQETAVRVVSNAQQESDADNVLGRPDDGLDERQYLSRTDISRLTGTSIATVDRWIRNGQLKSVKHGRTRRIARADLDHFLRSSA